MKTKQIDRQIHRGALQLRKLADSQIEHRLTLRSPIVWRTGVALAAAAMLIVALLPRQASAAALYRRAQAAIAGISGYHMTEYRIHGGSASMLRQFWVRDTDIRVESADRIDVNDDARAWIYRKDLGKAATFKVDASYSRFLNRDLSLSAFLDRSVAEGFETIDIDDQAKLEGKQAIRVTQERGALRCVVYFDSIKALPLRFEEFRRHDGEWQQAGYWVLDFPGTFDEALFDPVFPAEVKVVDTDSTPGSRRLVLELCDRP